MSRFYSPLRYPGGKNKLSAFIAQVCKDNNINGHYVEPYSGGASVALFLLLEGFVNHVTINDKDRSLYAFWYSVLNHADEFITRIAAIPVTVDEWRNQQEVQKNKETADLFELGFSTFYLNRTNRSGIISGGLIGGVGQNGNYQMDCRFNKEALINRIRRIADQADRISLYNLDALELMTMIDYPVDNTMIYFDPPYYNKASSLYLNHYAPLDHLHVRDEIRTIPYLWVVSYDNTPEINALYADFDDKKFEFKHTAYKAREGKEVMFFSQHLQLPDYEEWDPLRFKLNVTGGDKVLVYL
jgi:DNA adenine methylase